MYFQAILLTVVGLVMGSFMGLISLRLPKGEDMIVRRSHCNHCQTVLPPWQLIPLISYALNRGGCFKCRAPIPRRYPLFEAASALIGLWAGLHAPDLMSALFTAILGWNLLLIAVVDYEHFWLPDILTLPLFVSGIISALVLYPGSLMADLPHSLWRAAGPSLIGAACGLISLWLVAWLYRRLRGREGLGGGDPILFGAIGAWTGWVGLPSVLLYASLGGLSIVLAKMILRRPVSATDRLPFGTFLAFGAWLTWLYGPLGL